MMWNANTVAKEIYRILEEESNGSVHSVFDRSFNLIFKDKLIHIGAAENGMAPFGIGMDQFDAQMLIRKISLGQTVMWNARSKTLHITSEDVLSLQAASVTDPFLPAIPFNRTALEKNFAYLAEKLFADEWQTGIVQTDEEKKMILDYLMCNPSVTADHPVIKKIQQLQVFIKGQHKEALPVFDYWIGRGAGLTPSGDDILTGLCAAFAALEQDCARWTEKLASYLKQYGSKRTTAVSVAYLTYAAKHEFHSHLIQLMESLLQPDQQQISAALEEMKKMGHTSGTDTLIGVFAGMSTVLSGDLKKKRGEGLL